MSTPGSTPAFGQWMIGFIGFLMRLLLVLILAVGLGAGIYYATVTGVPWLYQRYVQPVEDNTLRLDDLEARQVQELELLSTRIEALQERLTDLEIQDDSDQETIRRLETQLATVESVQATQAAALATLEPLPTALTQTQSGLEALQTALDDLTTTVDAYDQQIQSLGEGDQEESLLLVSLHEELQLLRSMEFLTRARFFLSQGNLGEAEANIQAGLEVLTTLGAEVPDHQKSALERITAHLGEALRVLPDSPVGAADQLEGAWSLLVQGLPEEPLDTPTLTPTPND